MAALQVLRQVGKIADADFLALEVLPILWIFALGPLLDLEQFQSFMSLIKALSTHVEREQTRKLKDLTVSNALPASRATAKQNAVSANVSEGDVDFESLVTGRNSKTGTPDILSDWGAPNSRPSASRAPSQQQTSTASSFAWSTPAVASPTTWSLPVGQANPLRTPLAATRTVTPDQGSSTAFTALTPSTPYSQPLQPSRPMLPSNLSASHTAAVPPAINWSAASAQSAAPPGANRAMNGSIGSAARPTRQGMPSFSIPPPPTSPLALPNGAGFSNLNVASSQHRLGTNVQNSASAPKKGLDMYESLL